MCVYVCVIIKLEKDERSVEYYYMSIICGHIIETLQFKMEKGRRKQQSRRISLIVVIQAIGVNKG